MSTITVTPSVPARDAFFNHLVVAPTASTLLDGRPPRDAQFSQLTVSQTDYSTGFVARDALFSALVVTGSGIGGTGTIGGGGSIGYQ